MEYYGGKKRRTQRKTDTTTKEKKKNVEYDMITRIKEQKVYNNLNHKVGVGTDYTVHEPSYMIHVRHNIE